MRRLSGVLATLLLCLLLVPGTPVAAGSVEEAGDGQGGRMLLVLDASGSMAEPAGGGQTKMAAAKQALSRVVGDLPAETAVGLRVYGATVFSKDEPGACTDSQLVVEPATDNRDELRDAVGRFEPYGETPIGHALREAATDLGDEGSRSIVLVSDGIATCAPDPCKVAAELHEVGVDLRVDVVGLGVDGRARNQLRCIAAAAGGTYYNADSARDIVETLVRASTRASRPFSLTGTPVRGAEDPTDAPEIGVGQWTDVIGPVDGPRSRLYYRIPRTVPGSTLHVTATTRGTTDEWDRIEVTLTDPQGDRCAVGSDYRDTDQFAVLAAYTLAGPDTSWSPETCSSADALTLQVARDRLDGHRKAPMSLTVFEEPPVEDVEALPEQEDTGDFVPPRVGRAEPEPLVAGTSFADAPVVEPGRYALDIVPGETQLFRVPLDWGQQLVARFRFPAGTPGVRELTGAQGPFADAKIYNPVLGKVAPYADGANPTSILPGFNAGEVTVQSPAVRYRDRGSTPETPLAGSYFLALSANDDHDGDTWIQPYTLELEVRGQVEGTPSYVDAADPGDPFEVVLAGGTDVTDPDPTPTASATPEDDETPAEPAAGTADDSEDGSGGLLTAVVVLAALLVAAVAALVVMLVARRRKA